MCSHFRSTLHTVILDISNSRLARRTFFFGLRRKYCLTCSTLSSDTRGRPALFPLQRHPLVWNCLYQHLMLLGDGDYCWIVSQECPLNRNNWFILQKLQHTKRFLLRNRHYHRPREREIERERERDWERKKRGKLTSACVLKAVKADWKRSSHFDICGTRRVRKRSNICYKYFIAHLTAF